MPPAYQAMPSVDNGDLSIRDELLLPHPRSPEATQRNFANYCAMISHHDHCLGRLFERLRQSGQWENTIICFTSDHGLAVGSHGFLGKENMYDHSCRVPAILHGPGIPAGHETSRLSTSADLFPTLCELADIEAPQSIADGKSLTPLFDAEAAPLREAIHCAFRSPQMIDGEKTLSDTQRSIRTETHKMNWYPMTGQKQLFDLVHDPLEQDDLLLPWRRNTNQIWGYKPPPHSEKIDAITTSLIESMEDFFAQQNDPLMVELLHYSK